MAYCSGKSSKSDQILQAAFIGNLRRMKSGRGVTHAAAEKGRANICKYLIEELKFDVDEKDDEGCTPLLRQLLKGA
ncbi:hypothetical protein FRX31_003181 [Thalictrum thalictroides]|uniref:Uncharacterized protein n=1 Tax=Thalictrum thalictroides TaxID=46969 RepID=A0A7J6XBR5_THATH|nr:hypothetical protein FRX31_003181 [Thalictrum thalictroides]